MDYKSLQRHLLRYNPWPARPALGPELSALSPAVPHLVQWWWRFVVLEKKPSASKFSSTNIPQTSHSTAPQRPGHGCGCRAGQPRLPETLGENTSKTTVKHSWISFVIGAWEEIFRINGGYNSPKASQHGHRKIHGANRDDFVQLPWFPENIPPTALHQMPLSGTLDLGHPTLLQNASKKHLKSSKHMRDMKHMGRYETTLGVERGGVWNLIAWLGVLSIRRDDPWPHDL